MRLRPSPFEVPESGDPFVNDTLGRKDQIEALTRLVRNIEGPCVLAVDGAWGSGKTAFLKMWAQFMRNEDFRVVEFNAWETDFSDDPLMALYAALEAELGKLSTPDYKAALQAGAVVVAKLASAIPGMPDLLDTYAAAKGHTETSAIARLARHRDAEEAIRGFKEALAQATKGGLPLVVCVDELDRCRPDYAIRFLEATKHIFDVDGVVFVLGVNLSELANSVSALYGSNFKGATYLRRFVDRFLYLPRADRRRFFDGLLKSVGLADRTEPNTYIRIFLDIFVLGGPHMSLRDLEQAIYHLGMVLEAIPREGHPFGMSQDIIATTLMVFRMVAPDIYRQLIRGEISDLDTLKALNSLINRPAEWWKDSQNRHQREVSSKMEAVLINLGRYTSGPWETESPLLLLRRSEAEDPENRQWPNDYPQAVVLETEAPTDGRTFSRVLSLIDMIAYDPPSEP